MEPLAIPPQWGWDEDADLGADGVGNALVVAGTIRPIR